MVDGEIYGCVKSFSYLGDILDRGSEMDGSSSGNYCHL